MSAATALAARTGRLRAQLLAGSSGTQISLVAAQVAAGVGNLLVSLVAARLLDPGAYADAVTFLALYLVVNVPAAALTAAGAVDPTSARAARRTALPAAITAGIAIAALSTPLGAASGLGPAMVVVLAASLPGAALLGLARGEAYARHDVRAVTGSLLAEPMVRAGAGVMLMPLLGAAGAALAAVLGGYAAWWVCDRTPAGTKVRDAVTEAGWADLRSEPVPDRRLAVGVGMSFMALATLQIADLVIANARLDDLTAARFGALSTVGGAAVFATATVPLALLPDSARGDAAARRVALRLALAIGTAIALGGWITADTVLRVVAGDELAGASRWLGPYLVAMAALAAARVQIAARWTQGDGAFALRALVVAIVSQVLAQAALGTSIVAVVTTTLAVTTGLGIVLSFAPTPPIGPLAPVTPIGRLLGTERNAEHRTFGIRTEVLALAALCVLAATLRLATTRGLWVDEAISVRQAQLPFSEMVAQMRTTDVHPPLHHALLWLTVRVFGTSELAARLPSLIAGVALVPAMLWVGRVVYDRRTGWVAAGLAAIAPFCVWYSQEARMYSLFMLLATIAVGAQIQAVRRGERRDWLLYSASSAALLWTQYFALLPFAVQQLAFAVIAVRRWRAPATSDSPRTFVRNWLAATALVAAMIAPLLPILHEQFIAYTNRSDGLVPGQAGAASSAIGGTISIYAVGANLIWAIWGYHADTTMVQLTAFWPLLMLLVLVLLGRNRSQRTLLLAALVVVPLAALFLVGSRKRDLFELRYFSGAVPALILLSARLVTILARARRVLAAGVVVAAATLSAGLLDQQLNGANPRLYDFQGALEEVHRTDSGPRAVLLYEPAYLGDVIDYYAPDLDTRPLGSPVPDDASTVWVLASENVLGDEAISGRIGHVLAELTEQRTEANVIRRPNVRVWELR